MSKRRKPDPEAAFSDFRAHIAQAIAEYRKARFSTQIEFCEKVHEEFSHRFSPSTICNYEKGNEIPNLKSLRILCQAFECNWNDILGHVESGGDEINPGKDFYFMMAKISRLKPGSKERAVLYDIINAYVDGVAGQRGSKKQKSR